MWSTVLATKTITADTRIGSHSDARLIMASPATVTPAHGSPFGAGGPTRKGDSSGPSKARKLLSVKVKRRTLAGTPTPFSTLMKRLLRCATHLPENS